MRERLHEREVIRRRLDALVESSDDVRAGDRASRCARSTAGAGDPGSFDRLEALLAAQAYRLSLWRVAAHEINYRRFFDINELAAIRVEDPEVFAAVHALPLQLVRERIVTGFRIDHVDGLSDPEQYLADLRRAWIDAAGERRRGARRLRGGGEDPDARRAPAGRVGQPAGPPATSSST